MTTFYYFLLFTVYNPKFSKRIQGLFFFFGSAGLRKFYVHRFGCMYDIWNSRYVRQFWQRRTTKKCMYVRMIVDNTLHIIKNMFLEAIHIYLILNHGLKGCPLIHNTCVCVCV